MKTTTLTPFEHWMVERNLEYVKAEGLQPVLDRLRGQGYTRVANAVELVQVQSALINVTINYWREKGKK